MVRPTRSIVVTGIPISAAHPGLESAEKEISSRLFCGQSTVCILQGTVLVTNTWAIPKVARQGQVFCESCRTLMRVSAATCGRGLPAPESGVFPGIFAVQLHVKVRGHDAHRCRRFSAGGPVPVAVENLPRCGLLARKMLVGGRPMMAGYKRAGALNPTFRIIYREAQ
jgi:hypothetical protein